MAAPNTALNSENSGAIPEFPKKIAQMQFLLQNLNHFWAMEICDSLILEIEQKDIGISERLYLFDQLISAWQTHIDILILDMFNNWPFIYNSYHQLFDILLTVKDHVRIVECGLKLTKILLQNKFATNEQIAEFLESLALSTYHTHDYKSALEMLYLAIYFRGVYFKSTYFDQCFSHLEKVLKQIAPEHRPVLFNCFLNNIYLQFFNPNTTEMNEDNSEAGNSTYKDFVEVIYRASVNAVSPTIKESLQSLKKLQIKIRDFTATAESTQETVSALLLQQEYSWAYAIIFNYCGTLKELNRTPDAVKQMRSFIENCFRHGGFAVSFQAYQILADYIPRSSEGFNLSHIQLWIEAGKKFRTIKDQSYFVKVIEQIKNHLVPVLTFEGLQDFLFSYNEYYRLKRGFIRSSDEEFWWVVFHRAVFEEGFEDIARLAAKLLNLTSLPFIGRYFMEVIPDTIAKNKEKKESSKELDIGGMPPSKINIKFRIPKNSPVKILSQLYFASGFFEERLFELEEYWDEPHLLQYYLQLPRQQSSASPASQAKTPLPISLNQIQFGKLAYLFLPKEMRDFNNQLNLRTGHVPEISVMMDEPTFPLELMADLQSPLGVKYAYGYRFREPKLTPDKFITAEEGAKELKKFRILSIGDLNVDFPKLWNESAGKKEAVLSFPEGLNQARFIAQKANDLTHVIDEITTINPPNCARDLIEKELVSGKYHIIHISSNLFYIDDNPIESYFLTPDNQTISLNDILEMLSYARKHNKVQNIPFARPLLIFNGRVIVNSQEVIPRFFVHISKISKVFGSKHVLGIMARVSNEFNEPLQTFIGDFLEQILLSESIGSALLTANRRLFLTARKLAMGDSPNNELIQVLHETHFVFYGEPFVKLG